MKIIIIAAVAQNNVIGKSNGDLPWHLPEDFKHFKATTLGFPVIMGRKTFAALGKPLKNRINIVITHRMELLPSSEGITIVHSLEEAYAKAEEAGQEKAFIIGGGEIYKQSVHSADMLILSHLHFNAEGEVYFPEFDRSEWNIIQTDEREQFTITYYERKVKPVE
ncbi:MAG: dihydrofolate reductase [Ignavibacteriales bacterium]|nr:MAG: dihydrofolate reductase [Ignavibacteriales bacterium]